MVLDWFKRLTPSARRDYTRRERYRAVFSGPDGEWVLADILHRCGLIAAVHAVCEDGSGTDVFATGIVEGRRLAALQITSVLDMEMDEIIEAAREASKYDYEFEDSEETAQ